MWEILPGLSPHCCRLHRLSAARPWVAGDAWAELHPEHVGPPREVPLPRVLAWALALVLVEALRRVPQPRFQAAGASLPFLSFRELFLHDVVVCLTLFSGIGTTAKRNNRNNSVKSYAVFEAKVVFSANSFGGVGQALLRSNDLSIYPYSNGIN